MMRVCGFVLYTVVVVCLSIQSASAADDQHAAGAAAGKNRFGEANTLTTNESWIVWKGFATTDDFVRARWDEKLPLALEGARFDMKEDDIAGILSKLVGMVNSDQFLEMGKLVKEKAGALEKSDNRYAELLKHMEWTKEILSPSEKEEDKKFKTEGEQFEKYKKAFLEKWTEQKKKNDDFYALLEKTEKGTDAEKAAAKETLRSKYDAKALPSFIANSKKELGDRLGTALSWKDGDKQFIDTLGKKGEKVRINIGAEGAQAALKQFATAQGGLPTNQLSFSAKKHDQPTVWFTPGQPVKTAVGGAVPGPATAQQVAQKQAQAQPQQPKQKEFNAADSAAKDATATAQMTTSCTRCHGQGKKNEKDFNLTNFLANPKKGGLKNVFEKVVNGKDGFMPPTDTGGSPELKASVRVWANANGVN